MKKLATITKTKVSGKVAAATVTMAVVVGATFVGSGLLPAISGNDDSKSSGTTDSTQIYIINPIDNPTWVRGTTHDITWSYYSSSEKGYPKIDLALQSLTTKANFQIAHGILTIHGKYSWKVGLHESSTSKEVPTDSYKIKICFTDTNICSSNGRVTVTNATQ